MIENTAENERIGRAYRHKLIGFVVLKFVVLTLIGLYVAFFVV